MSLEDKAEENIVDASVDETKDSDFDEKKKSRFTSLKSRGIFLAISIVMGIILTLLALPGFFDNSSLKFKVEQKASEFLGSSLSINEGLEIAFFPQPSIIAHKVLIQNYKNDGKVYNIYSEQIRINLSFSQFLQNNFKIRKITLVTPSVESFYEINSGNTRQNKFTEIANTILQNPATNDTQNLSKGLSSNLFAIDKFDTKNFSINNLSAFEIEQGNLTSYDKISRKKEIENIFGKLKISEDKIQSSGKFTNQGINNEFKLVAHFNANPDKQNSILELNSSAAHIVIKGAFTSKNEGLTNSHFIGKLDAEIFELRSFYHGYISNNNAIYEKLKPNLQSIKISSDLKNKGGEISFENIIINSGVIEGNGSALVDLTSELPKLDINLDLNSLDLDKIWSGDRIETKEEKKLSSEENNQDDSTETLSQSSPDKTPADSTEVKADETTKNETKKPDELNLKITSRIKDFDLSSEIKIKTVKFLDGEIKDLSLYLTISKEGKILILPIIFQIPGEASVRINGALDNDSDLPKFIGKIDISGQNLGEGLRWIKLESKNLKFDNLKDYILYSDLMLLPNKIVLNNLYLSLNKGESEFLGEVQIDSSAKITNTTTKFQVSTFNIDDFFSTSGNSSYLSPGSLLQKLLWLNSISSNNNVDLTFDKLIYKDEEFANPSSLKLNFGQGYLKVTELTIKSKKTDLQAVLGIDISNQNPEFNLDILADKLHYKSDQTQENNNDTSKTPAQKKTFVDQLFALPSLEGFNGNVAIVAQSFTIDDLDLENVKLNGKIKDGLIPEAKFDCELYNGSLNYKGTIGVKIDKILNGNISANKINFGSLLQDTVGTRNIAGVANISANITSVARSKEDFVKTLNSEIKFSSNAPTVTSYGLNDLVNKMFYPANFHQELQIPEKIIENPASKTTLKQASGTISIDQNKGGQFSINFSTTAANGVFAGKVDLSTNEIDGTSNVIFVTGSRQKQIPINIATALKGNIDNGIAINSNLDQVRQYLRLPTLNPVTKTTTPAPATTTDTKIPNTNVPNQPTDSNANKTTNSPNMVNSDLQNQGLKLQEKKQIDDVMIQLQNNVPANSPNQINPNPIQ